MGHKISDIVYETLTGVRGAFSTQIAYISTTGEAANRKFELRVADADGHNARTIFSSSDQLMSPAWSPDGKRLAYVSFEKGNSAIYVQDVKEGRRFMVSAQPGINSAPAWSPDGRYLALTLPSVAVTDIYSHGYPYPPAQGAYPGLEHRHRALLDADRKRLLFHF